MIVDKMQMEVKLYLVTILKMTINMNSGILLAVYTNCTY